jgi:hypothetical protein
MQKQLEEDATLGGAAEGRTTARLWLQTLFVLTGVVKTVGFQLIAYAAPLSAFWTLLPSSLPYVAPIFGVLLLRFRLLLSLPRSTLLRALMAAVLDVVGTILNVLAYRFAGSGYVSLICSSMPACTSLLAACCGSRGSR